MLFLRFPPPPLVSSTCLCGLFFCQGCWFMLHCGCSPDNKASTGTNGYWQGSQQEPLFPIYLATCSWGGRRRRRGKSAVWGFLLYLNQFSPPIKRLLLNRLAVYEQGQFLTGFLPFFPCHAMRRLKMHDLLCSVGITCLFSAWRWNWRGRGGHEITNAASLKMRIPFKTPSTDGLIGSV